MVMMLALLGTEAEKALFQEIYERNYKKMYYIARRILGSHEQAEDVVHEAFLKIVRRFERYESLPKERMEALCVTVAKHVAIDWYRRQQHMTEEELETVLLYREDDRPALQAIVEQKELSRQVLTAMEELPEVLKITLQLRYYQEYSNREIAQLLGIPEKTVEMRLYRGRKKLGELLAWSRQGTEQTGM